MQLENVIRRLLKFVNTRVNALSISITSGSIDNMEKYKYMLGQAHAYEYISQEISNLLDKKEQKNEQGTVIDLEKRGPKA